MNERVIVTSLALVAAMGIVLAIGKAEHVEGAQVWSENQGADVVNSTMEIDVDQAEEEQILMDQPKIPASEQRNIAIVSDIDEGDIILETDTSSKRVDSAVVSPDLKETLLRMQAAMDKLKQVAAETARVVAEMENG